MRSERKTYAILALVVFLIEVVIALYVRDAIVRPYVGDTLAVILVYLVLRATGWFRMWSAILLALAAGVVVELAQLYRLLWTWGLQDNVVARTVLGSQFEWLDLVAYAAGGLCIWVVEGLRTVPGSPRGAGRPNMRR